MRRRARVLALIGETSREVGILMLVFAPLDWMFTDDRGDPLAVTATGSGGLILIGYGILLESKE